MSTYLNLICIQSPFHLNYTFSGIIIFTVVYSLILKTQIEGEGVSCGVTGSKRSLGYYGGLNVQKGQAGSKGALIF